MKRIKYLSIFLLICLLFTGCSTIQTQETETVSEPVETEVKNNAAVDIDAMPSEQPQPKPQKEPQNVIEIAKENVHNAIFKEKTETTQKIVDRLFKNMEYTVIDSVVDGDDSYVVMLITNINAGKAWIRTLENYAKMTAENLLSDKQIGAEELYCEYLDELEDTFKQSDFITIPVIVEMEFENYQWVWDFDDSVINAISGNLLAAIEGDINSACFLDEVDATDDYVYIAFNTTTYHFNEHCKDANGADAFYRLSWKDCKKMGYKMCERCGLSN